MKYKKNISLFIPVFADSPMPIYKPALLIDFYMFKRREITQGCTFWVIRLKFNIQPLFILQTINFWPESFLRLIQRLTVGMLKSKLPLIIIVDSIKVA